MTTPGKAGAARGARGPIGAIYLIHFVRRFHHARHYLGWTLDLPGRLASHRAGRGAKLLRALAQAGIGWELVCWWIGTRADERRMKRRKGTPRLCPACGGRMETLGSN